MKFVLLILISSISIFSIAQEEELVFQEIKENSTYLANLDSLMNLWYVKQTNNSKVLKQAPADRDTNYNPIFSDSVYLQKITDMNSIINLSYNTRVRAFINLYANNRRDQVEYMLGLTEYYFPIFEEILDYHGVPIELKYLAVIESALNPRARSKANAVGLWQFIFSTGRMYDLKIDSYIDERCDPIKSTHAAARFLKDLNIMFDDWVLALAAYNCGPGNVRKAIRRSGGRKDYWEIYNYLPRETRGYVPAFIAARYVMEHYQEHNLYPKPIALPYPIDTIVVTRKVHLKQISEVLNIPFAQLSDMNPHYRIGIIPNSKQGNNLYVPFEYGVKFIELEDSIIKYKDSIYLNTDHISSTPSTSSSSNYAASPPPAGYEKIVYTIKSGDNLGYISSWFNVRISDLRHWNGIAGNSIRAGQKINIYVSPSKSDYYKGVAKMSFAEKQATVGKTVPSNSTRTNTSQFSGEFIYYTVRSGDTFWGIAKQFSGITEHDIMKANGITDARALSAGMKIKIPKK